MIDIVFENQEALTPVGKPVAEPIPVAPVVAIVIGELSAVPIQTVGVEDAAPAVLLGFTTTSTAFEVVEHELELTTQ